MSNRFVISSALQPYGVNEVGHQGLTHDEENGQIQNRNRVLVARMERYLQRDPLGYVDGINLYQYVNGNPVFGLDPGGTWGWFSPGAWYHYQLPHWLGTWISDYVPPHNDRATGTHILVEYFNSVGPTHRDFGPSSFMTGVILEQAVVKDARQQAKSNIVTSSTNTVVFYKPHTDPIPDVAQMLANKATNGHIGNMGGIGGFTGEVRIVEYAPCKFRCTFVITNSTNPQSGGGSGPANRPVTQKWEWTEEYDNSANRLDVPPPISPSESLPWWINGL